MAVPRITEICRLYNGNSWRARDIRTLRSFCHCKHIYCSQIQRIKESKVAANMNPKIANQIIAAVDAGSLVVRS
jgi:hypothetical protein